MRLSLCCPQTLPVVDDDGDEEMEIVKENTESTCIEAHSNSNVEKASANEELNSSRDLRDQNANISVIQRQCRCKWMAMLRKMIKIVGFSKMVW